MEIKKKEISIRDLAKDYINNEEEGVIGFGGNLDIRPPYQREFVYNPKERNLVINTVKSDFPLNTMYWNTKEDGSFEVLDGQQRTISICEYVTNKFNIEGKYFNNLPNDIQQDILDYRLDIYQCEGLPSERIEWFQIINIAGKTLTNQEILNAIYSGSWVTDAKKYFSKTGCPAHALASDFMNGKPLRQDYLEAVLKWISKDNIKEYMGKHQHKTDAIELWDYFKDVIDWVETIFVGNKKTDIRSKYMKKVPWGELYNEFKDENLDPKKIQAEVSKLMQDDDIKNLQGIYRYVLDGQETHLDIRGFPDRDRQQAYEKQNGKCNNKRNCPKKGETLDISEMHADHIKPWSKGGRTEADNCQMLCEDCNRRKGNI